MLWRGGLAALPGFRYSSGVIADAERQLPMLAALASAPTVRTHCARADDATLKRRIATLMTTKRRKQPAGKSANSGSPQPAKSKQPAGKTANSGGQQPTKSKKPTFVSRYIGIDSHLTERNGAGGLVFTMAAERPVGRKLAEDISRQCVQLDAEGYDVISIFPLTSGRSAKAAVETERNSHGNGLAYTRSWEVEDGNDYWGNPRTKRVDTRHIDTGVGYSVTDGVVITAKLRK